jgi:cbb3-type cytochrome oxidase subunit 1
VTVELAATLADDEEVTETPLILMLVMEATGGVVAEAATLKTPWKSVRSSAVLGPVTLSLRS